MSHPASLEINDRIFTHPGQPIVVICIDGSEPDYHISAMAAGRMPFLKSMLQTGTDLIGTCVMPSFTNPNNLSIATAAPPAVHGICGNYFFDSARNVEVMMNDPRLLKAQTVFAAFDHAGLDVAVITAKEKLRRLLGHGLQRGVCFSAEEADKVTEENNRITDLLRFVGRPLPSVYSADLSEFALAAGARLLETIRPDIMYVSLTDYVQHKFAPGTPQANDFYEMLDAYFSRIDALGAILLVTADHGMNAKTRADGTPNAIYLQELLDTWLGDDKSRVILPITDPYVAHHGALGSFACIYLEKACHKDIACRLADTPGIETVLTREEASHRFELPPDRIGDLIVIARADVVLATSADRHDLSQLDRPLRSHGGLSEQHVPFMVNRRILPLPDNYRLRNFDAYWVAMNLVRADT